MLTLIILRVHTSTSSHSSIHSHNSQTVRHVSMTLPTLQAIDAIDLP